MGVRLAFYQKRQRWKRALNRTLNGSCAVLLYHRIHESAYDPQRLCVSPENFRAHLRWLKKHYRVLSVEEFDAALNRGSFPRKSVLVTFDDGYADNLHEALPILSEEGVQALFYVATATIGTDKLFWWDELDLVFRSEVNETYLKSLLNGKFVADKKALYAYYLERLKRSASLPAREALLAEIRPLRVLQEPELKPYKSLGLEELKLFAANSHVMIGAHTVNHLSLGALTKDVQFDEMNTSVKFLEGLLKNKIRHFSYPYGEAQDYNAATLEISSLLGLQNAAANFSGIVSKGADRFSFPRIVVRNGGVETLKAALSVAR